MPLIYHKFRPELSRQKSINEFECLYDDETPSYSELINQHRHMTYYTNKIIFMIKYLFVKMICSLRIVHNVTNA